MEKNHSYKLIIAGSRTFNNYRLLEICCNSVLKDIQQSKEITIISGHARGADSLGEQYAKSKGFNLQLYPADWNAHGKVAGFIRNAQMAEVADALIVFWDGKSRGTANMIDHARRKGIPVKVISDDSIIRKPDLKCNFYD